MSQAQTRNDGKLELAYRRNHLLSLIEMSARGAREKTALAQQIATEAGKTTIVAPANKPGIAGKVQPQSGEMINQANTLMAQANNDINNIVAAAMELGQLCGMVEATPRGQTDAEAIAEKEQSLEEKATAGGIILPKGA